MAMIGELDKVASMADYIRCDMAYLTLNSLVESHWGRFLRSWNVSRPTVEFWELAIAQTKFKYPTVKFVAEVYEPYTEQLQQMGFDYTYDKVRQHACQSLCVWRVSALADSMDGRAGAVRQVVVRTSR
jgi:histidinol-phosphate/aromatic aminotransferase/cobyric acid decarboxylase-like protein